MKMSFVLRWNLEKEQSLYDFFKGIRDLSDRMSQEQMELGEIPDEFLGTSFI
jgi:hypothetical protein